MAVSTERVTLDDVKQQAELLIMDYMKTNQFTRPFDEFIKNKLSSTNKSTTASNLYSQDLQEVKCQNDNSSFEITALAKIVKSVLSNDIKKKKKSKRLVCHRDSLTLGVQASCDNVWSKDTVRRLKKAIKETKTISDKQMRWKEIAAMVGSGQTKKTCYLKYKELKNGKSATPKLSISMPPHKEILDGKDDSTHVRAAEIPISSQQHNILRKHIEPTSSPTASCVSQDLQLEDCEDFNEMDCRTISKTYCPQIYSCNTIASVCHKPGMNDIKAYRKILMGEAKCDFTKNWYQQGFCFSTKQNLQYGLEQHKGGPCGVLACVQAFVLKHLFQKFSQDWQNPSTQEQESAVVAALSDILWQGSKTGTTGIVQIAVIDKEQRTVARRFMAGVKFYEAKNSQESQSILKEYINLYMSSTGNGVELFVLSIIRTKGLPQIYEDIDKCKNETGNEQSGIFIAVHDYCTQELVNMLLCGSAFSNVFDGNKSLESTNNDEASSALLLKGIPRQCEIGFLSLYEAYNYLEVGSYLKSPKLNIWVICSESHYSVIFSPPNNIGNMQLSKQGTFDLYYFDGLANQDGPIRLNVQLGESTAPKFDDELEIIPPLNRVIQTKWPGARIEWVGVEPWL